MKKRVLAITLILATLLGCLCACGKNKKKQDDATDPTQNNIIASSYSVLWNDVYYFSSKIDENTYTLQYANLKNITDGAFNVYSDVLGAADDPFTAKTGMSTQLIVDEEATKENGGLPVLLVTTSELIHITSEDGEDEKYMKYDLWSFNTANNQLHIIAEDVGNSTFWLYKDRIYVAAFLDEEDYFADNPEESDGNGGYVMYSIPKTGGTPQRHELPERSFAYELLTVKDEKIYFYIRKLGSIYKADLDFSNAELITDSIPKDDMSGKITFIQSLFYNDGYVYYQKKSEIKEIDGVEVKYFSLYRRPLEDLSSKAEEAVLSDLTGIGSTEGGKIYYTILADVEIVDVNGEKKINAEAMFHVYDLKTGEDRVLFDFRNDKEKEGRMWGGLICEDYYVFYISGHEKYSDWTLIELATGKESPFPEF